MPSLCLAGLALSAPSPQAEPVAVVLWVEGPVQVLREVRDSTGAPTLDVRPARVGRTLRAGDRLEPREGGRVTTVNRAGRSEVFADPVFVEEPSPDPEAGATPDALFARALRVLDPAPAVAARSAPNRVGRIRSVAGVPMPIAPRNGVLVMEAQPRLEWFGVRGGGDYSVQLRTEGQVPLRYTTADTTLVVPRALAPGRTYHWAVSAGDRVSPETTLRTISDAEATELVRGLATLRARGFAPDGEARLLKVVLYTDLGLLHAALAELYALEAQAGELGVDALLLQGRILDQLGRLPEARDAFERADAMGPGDTVGRSDARGGA